MNSYVKVLPVTQPLETQGISRGQTLVDRFDFWQKPANSSIIMTEVDSHLFFRKFLTVLLNAQEETIKKDLEKIKDGMKKNVE